MGEEVSAEMNWNNWRVDVIRHGERVDGYFQLYLAPEKHAEGIRWVDECGKDGGVYRPLDENFPDFLPDREGGLAVYAKDCPLTLRGIKDAEEMGRQMREYPMEAEAIYASPALRSVQTAAAILKGLGRPIPIRIEPGFLEYFGKDFVPPVIPPSDLYHLHGIRDIDLSYVPVIAYEDLKVESVEEFYRRSHDALEAVLKRSSSRHLCVVAHSTSRDNLHRILRGLPPLRTELEFRRMLHTSSWAAFLSASAIEAPSSSGPWTLAPPIPQPTPHLRSQKNSWTDLNKCFTRATSYDQANAT